VTGRRCTEEKKSTTPLSQSKISVYVPPFVPRERQGRKGPARAGVSGRGADGTRRARGTAVATEGHVGNKNDRKVGGDLNSGGGPVTNGGDIANIDKTQKERGTMLIGKYGREEEFWEAFATEGWVSCTQTGLDRRSSTRKEEKETGSTEKRLDHTPQKRDNAGLG